MLALIFSLSLFPTWSKSKPISLDQLISQMPQFCQKQIGVETLILGKRERLRQCSFRNEKCLSCISTTRQIVDLNNFPIVEKSLNDVEKTVEKCQPDFKLDPVTYIDETHRAYKVTFSAFPLILFSLGVDSSLKAFHLREKPLKSYLSPNLMLLSNCPRLFKKDFFVWGHWDQGPEGPKLKSLSPLKVKYKNPLVPPTNEERTVFSSLQLDDSKNPFGGLNIGDAVQVKGRFKMITSRKFAPEMPTLPEKNSLLVFEVESLTRRPQP